MSETMPFEDGRSRIPVWARISHLLLWVLVLTLIALNALLIAQLLALRQAAHDAIVEASAVLADVQGQTISLTIPVDDTLVIETEFPVQDTVVVPIETTIPVGGAATVEPIPGIPLAVPFGANVPVDITVDVPIDTSIAITVPVELDMEVPVEFALSDTPLAGTLDEIQVSLDALATELDGPFAP